MPGFSISTPSGGVIGVGPTSDAKPFFNYTWEIYQLFDLVVDTNSVLAYARDCTLPVFSAIQDTVDGSSLIYKYADKVSWEDIRISFYDIPQSGIVLIDLMREWRRRIWTPELGIGQAVENDGGLRAGYKKESIITVLNCDETQKRYWILSGSWPKVIKSSELTYTETKVSVVEVTVTYDWADNVESL